MVRRVGASFLIFFVLLAGISHVHAGEWQIIGPRALGMGGANVAVANDATASYWNPGAFGFFKKAEEDHYGKRDWSNTLGVGIGAQLHGNFGEALDKITKIDFDGIDDGTVSAEKVSDFINLLNALDDFTGSNNRVAMVLGDSNFGVQIGHYGLGAQAFLNVSAKLENLDLKNIGPGNAPVFTIDDFTDPKTLGCPTSSPSSCTGSVLSVAERNDLDQHLLGLGWSPSQRAGFIAAVDNGLAQSGEPIPADIVEQLENTATLADNAAGSGPLSKNESKLRFRGIGLVEIPLTYGHAFSENLSVGGNLKYMKARVYDISVDILDQDFGDALDEALDNYQEKSNFGIDLGVLYRLRDSLRVGLVGRNLNAPKFAGIKEKAQLRTGLAYQPRHFITLAADIDLTKNDASAGSDLKSQNIGAGLELSLLKILKLRGGVYKNLAESDIGLVYTAGLGLNLWVVHLDVGAARSRESTDLDGKSIPEEVRGEFALSALF